jgi:hypothetical protein
VRWPDDDIGYEVRRLSGGHGNRAIVSAHAVPDPTTPDHVSIAVEVRSFDAPGATHVRLMMGDEQVARETVDLSTGTARVTLHAPIRDDGEPSARLVLEGRDALSVDDARAVLLRPNGALRVLLVDGDPHPNRDRDEVGYLARALDLSPPDAGLISYRVVDSDTAEALDLAAWDVIVLANVRVPSAHASERLVRFVEGGGGLLVSAGDRVDPASYQARLGTILPGRPRAISGAPAPLTLTRDEAADVRDDSLPTSEGLEGVRVTRRLLIEPSATARIPLRFADTTPALVVGGDAGGRVALLAIPVDTAWSDLPYRPGFLPLVIELLIHLGPTARLPENAVAPGTPVTVPVPSGADRVVVLTPDGVRHEGAPHQALVLEDTSAPGAYRVMAFTEGAPHDTEPDAAFLVAPRAEESDLRDAEVQTEEAGVVIDGEGHDGGAIVRRSIAVWFFLFAGILAVLEALLRSRRPFATA